MERININVAPESQAEKFQKGKIKRGVKKTGNTSQALELAKRKTIGNRIEIHDMINYFNIARGGMPYRTFFYTYDKSKMSYNEWANILHISERTLQRYKKESLSFDPLQSEKILQVSLILHKGEEVFGDEEKFNLWLNEENLSLGGYKPKELLDNAFGIKMIEDELVKIEYGILA